MTLDDDAPHAWWPSPRHASYNGNRQHNEALLPSHAATIVKIPAIMDTLHTAEHSIRPTR